jgi:hypothetical protein
VTLRGRFWVTPEGRTVTRKALCGAEL